MNQFQSIDSGKGILKNFYNDKKDKKMNTPIYDALKRRNQKRREKYIVGGDEKL